MPFLLELKELGLGLRFPHLRRARSCVSDRLEIRYSFHKFATQPWSSLLGNHYLTLLQFSAPFYFFCKLLEHGKGIPDELRTTPLALGLLYIMYQLQTLIRWRFCSFVQTFLMTIFICDFGLKILIGSLKCNFQFPAGTRSSMICLCKLTFNY